MRSRRSLTIAAAGLVAATLALSACSGGGSTTPTGGGPATAPLLTLTSIIEPTSYDPAQANEGHYAPLYQAVYDTLIKRDPDGSLSPMLATSWKWDTDRRALTLKLRSGVTFTDGATFDAAAVKANIEHFKSANGPLVNTLRSVTSVDTPDTHTVVLHLSQPDPALETSLSSAAGYMGSPKALGTKEITTQPDGTGPYVLDKADSVPGSTIVYDRNKKYWGDRLPYDRIEFRIMTDESARLNALLAGQVDVAYFNRPANSVEAKSAGFLTTPYTTGFEGILFFDRDGKMVPQLKDVRVREALSLAIDRDALIKKVALGRGERTSQTFGPDTGGFIPSLEDAYGYDPKKAKQLLAEAGASHLTFEFHTSGVFDPLVYDAIFQDWANIGVTVKRTQWGPGEAVPSMQRGDVPLAYMSLAQGNDWSHIQFMLSPTAPWNPFHSESPKLDALIAQYPTASAKKQVELAQEINKFIVDQYWFAPVMRPVQGLFWDKKVDVKPQAQQVVPSIYNYTPAKG
ncbi:ABC transporter substrate-binding protein [Microbacterium sp.]|uniref:ABC transporter substrate-binding protein n=1 Tax=Microbacterium sp. TaxID=51671 RepID=UPI001AC7E13D|nr:ABC transporter substrate-binding protein [Microbacterium sp.]MBN9193907.1 ABC transporter substrate-binding protein [Microbacterium sp.]